VVHTLLIGVSVGTTFTIPLSQVGEVVGCRAYLTSMMKLRSPLTAVSLLCLIGKGEGYSTTTTYRQTASPAINSSTRLGMSDNDGFKSSFTPGKELVWVG